jgi:ribosomal protein L40E
MAEISIDQIPAGKYQAYQIDPIELAVDTIKTCQNCGQINGAGAPRCKKCMGQNLLHNEIHVLQCSLAVKVGEVRAVVRWTQKVTPEPVKKSTGEVVTREDGTTLTHALIAEDALELMGHGNVREHGWDNVFATLPKGADGKAKIFTVQISESSGKKYVKIASDRGYASKKLEGQARENALAKLRAMYGFSGGGSNETPF